MTANRFHKKYSVYSNVAYLLPAVTSFIQGHPGLGTLFALLAFNSFQFHRSPTNISWQNADVASIYSIFAYLPFVITGIWEVAVVSFTFGLPYIINKLNKKPPVSSTTVVTIMFGATAVLSWGNPYFWFAISSFLSAGGLSVFAERFDRIADEHLNIAKEFKVGSPYVQSLKAYRVSDIFHAGWHILTGAGFNFIVMGIIN